MKGVLINVPNYEELRQLSPRDRIKVNGVEAAVLFPGEGDVAIFVRTDSRGNVVELTNEGFKINYTRDGVQIGGTWHRSGFYYSQKDLLEEMGAID